MLTRKLIDLAAILTSCSLAYYLRFGELVVAAEYQVPILVFMLLAHLCLTSLGYYEKSSTSGTTSEKSVVAYALAIAATLTTFFLYLTKSSADYSRIWFVLMMFSSIIMILIASAIVRYATRHSDQQINIVVLGSNLNVEKLIRKFNNSGKKIKIVETIELDSEPIHQETAWLKKLEALIEEYRVSEKNVISEVWITREAYSAHTPTQLLLELGRSSVNIVWVTDYLDLPSDSFKVQNVDGIITANTDPSTNREFELLVKSLFDRSIATILMLALLPIFLLISIGIKLDSKGSVFYRQSRYGLHGKEFQIWKFRTMTVNESTDEFRQATFDDPRITRFGHFLRRTSLDELPQLLNVITGSMSLVGPRPHPNLLNEEFKTLVDRYMARHAMKPGITGLAQVSGSRGETPEIEDMSKRIMHDLEYISTWSLRKDLRILIKTLGILIRW